MLRVVAGKVSPFDDVCADGFEIVPVDGGERYSQVLAWLAVDDEAVRGRYSTCGGAGHCGEANRRVGSQPCGEIIEERGRPNWRIAVRGQRHSSGDDAARVEAGVQAERGHQAAREEA